MKAAKSAHRAHAGLDLGAATTGARGVVASSWRDNCLIMGLVVAMGTACTTTSGASGGGGVGKGDAASVSSSKQTAENCPATGYGLTLNGTSAQMELSFSPASLGLYTPDKYGDYEPNNSASPTCCHQVDVTCTFALKVLLDARSSDCKSWELSYFPTADCKQKVFPGCKPKNQTDCDPAQEDGVVLTQQIGATSVSALGGAEYLVRAADGLLSHDPTTSGAAGDAQAKQILTPLAEAHGYLADPYHGYFLAASYLPEKLEMGPNAKLTATITLALVKPTSTDETMRYNAANTVISKTQFLLVLEGPNPP